MDRQNRDVHIPDLITPDGRWYQHYSPPERKFPALNLALFLITIITTTMAGTGLEGVTASELLRDPLQSLSKGLPFAITLMTILLTHEMGHFFMARRYKVSASLPYFIPAPFGVGTFGAIIKMQSPINSRKSLIDIGAAGPIAGFVVATVALVYAVSDSKLISLSDLRDGGIRFGDPLILKIINYFFFGSIPNGYDINLTSVGFAGWLGMLVTSLNLLPVGQLDGGHIAYAIFQERAIWISRGIFIILMFLGIFFWPGWLFWGVLSFFIIGLKHPPIRPGADIKLDTRHKVIAYLCLVIFILTFIPAPVMEIK